MFKSLKDWNKWHKAIQYMDQQVLDDAFIFYERFPHAPVQYGLKVLKFLEKGISIESIVTSYAKKEFKKGEKEGKETYRRIFTMEDCREEMLYDLRHGKEKGTTTHIEKLDNAWTWRRGEFNIWTGYANEGKSLFLRFLCLIKAIKEKWKFAFYAPEDYPPKEFFDDIIHTASGYSTDKDNPLHIDESLYNRILDEIKSYFFFVYIKPPENDLISILREFNELIDKEEINAWIIDPFLKVARPKEYMTADDKYAGYFDTLCTDFARETNTSGHLVMHQLTPRLQENGLYSKPTMYQVKGGGSWVDGVDNLNSIWRPYYAKDKGDDEVMFSSHKIKKQKLVGIPQDIKFRFNRKTNRYVDYNNKKDVFKFDKELGIERYTGKFDFSGGAIDDRSQDSAKLFIETDEGW